MPDSANGMNPAMVVDKLRPFTQRIWRHFSVAEKQEFSQQYRTRWNVVRHRIPPTVARQIEAAQKEGRLHILRGALLIRRAAAVASRLRSTRKTGNHHMSWL